MLPAAKDSDLCTLSDLAEAICYTNTRRDSLLIVPGISYSCQFMFIVSLYIASLSIEPTFACGK